MLKCPKCENSDRIITDGWANEVWSSECGMLSTYEQPFSCKACGHSWVETWDEGS